jgi:hypothetical protein
VDDEAEENESEGAADSRSIDSCRWPNVGIIGSEYDADAEGSE